MNIQRKLVVGKNEYTISFDAEDASDFVKIASFLDSLPTQGPNGETDLVFSYRTPKNYEYYSIVSLAAGMEFKFGQHKERPGSLFAKGWEPLYQGEEQEASNQNASIGLGGIGATTSTQAQQQVVTPAPVQTPNKVQTQAPAQVSPNAQDILGKFGIRQ